LTYLDVALRALLCAVFAAAAAGKLRSAVTRVELADAIDTLLVTGERAAALIANAVVVAEVAVVALLLVPATTAFGFGLGALVLLGFTAVLALGLRRGRNVRCQCFGLDGGEVGLQHLVRNGLLIACGCVGVAVTGGVQGADAGGVIVAVLAGASAGWLLTRWDDMVFLITAFAPTRKVEV
jgi:hypothetical protein